MASKKAKSDTGHLDGTTNTRKSSLNRGPPHQKHSARSLCSVDSHISGDGLSVSGSSIEYPVIKGTRHTKDFHGISKRTESKDTAISRKPASPKLRHTETPKTKRPPSPSLHEGKRVAAKSRAKPAWLLTPCDTPRSDVSDRPSLIPPKPSLDDFLDIVQNDHGTDGTNWLENSNISTPADKQKASFVGQHTDAIQHRNEWPSSGLYHQTLLETESNLRPNNVEIPGDAIPKTDVSRTANAHTGKSTTVDYRMVSGEDHLDKRRERAAKTIQIWYRRLRNRRKAGEAALKRLMEHKKIEMESRMSTEKLKSNQDTGNADSEYERKKRREEKARQARLAAIEELRTKREGTNKETKSDKKDSLTFLQLSGKVTKEKSKPGDSNKMPKPRSGDFGKLASAPITYDNRPSTSSSIGRKVNEIFEDSKSRNSKVEVNESMSAISEASAVESTATLKESKTTFEDLMSTLKELEYNPVNPANPEVIRAEGKEDRLNLHEQPGTTSYSNVALQDDQRYESVQGPLLSADKLQTIMNFLDEVEKAEEDIRSEVTRQSKDSTIRGSFPAWNNDNSFLEKELTPNDSASQVATDIGNAITAQKQELSQKNESLNMLKKALNQQKEFSTIHVQELEKEHKQQLGIQRKEYESTIQRHLSFIDQLIDDKKALSSRCELLVKKLKETDEKYTSKIKKMEDEHSVELKKQKELMEAAEKLRREKWVQEKTKQIKEMTVKGLEPDIQRLIGKHKGEIKKLKAMHQGELLESDERAGRKYIRQIEEIRERLEEEKDAAVQKERDIAKQRFEKQLEQEEESYQQQRRRLLSEVQDEKERIGKQIHAMREELHEEKNASESSSRQSLVKLQEDHQKTIDEMERRHTTEMNNLKEQLEIEKQQWVENHMKKQEVYLLSKERELKDSVRETRDKEIEMVIARLEDETAKARDENSRATENRIKRIVDKYENEMKELERSEKIIQEKYNKLKVQMQEQEGDDIRLRSQIKQKEQEVFDMKRLTDKLQEERGKVSDIIRQEFADRLVTLEEDNKRLRTEISEMRARHRLEIDRISNEKEHEMEEVHKRVKQAVSKKEETTNLLRQQMKAAEKRAEQLEMLLAEQRKKLLS